MFGLQWNMIMSLHVTDSNERTSRSSIEGPCCRPNASEWTFVMCAECNYVLCRECSFRAIYVTLFVYDLLLLCARKCCWVLWLAVKIRSVKTEFLEPFDRCEAQLVSEDRWTAEEQNWSISGIEFDCVSANRTWVQVKTIWARTARYTLKQSSCIRDCKRMWWTLYQPLSSLFMPFDTMFNTTL